MAAYFVVNDTTLFNRPWNYTTSRDATHHVDHGRHQTSRERGGRITHVELDDLLHAAKTAAVPVEDLLTLEGALTRLEAVDPRGAEIVALRFFSGMSVPEVAAQLGVSVSTVEHKWTHARAWLRRDLAQGPPPA